MKLVTLIKIVPGHMCRGLDKIRQIAQTVTNTDSNCTVEGCRITYGSFDAVVSWTAPDMNTAKKVIQAIVKDNHLTAETMSAQDYNEF